MRSEVLGPEAPRLSGETNCGMLVCDMYRIFGTKRVSRRWISAVGLFAFLFAQLSLAGYACPRLGEIEGTGVVMDHAKAPCAETDLRQPLMCHEHCKDQAGIDHVQLPFVPSAMAMAHSLVIPLFDTHHAVIPASCAGPDPDRVTGPPPSILFCVFRS
jgi:hypothetical protein